MPANLSYRDSTPSGILGAASSSRNLAIGPDVSSVGGRRPSAEPEASLEATERRVLSGNVDNAALPTVVAAAAARGAGGTKATTGAMLVLQVVMVTTTRGTLTTRRGNLMVGGGVWGLFYP